MSTEQHEEQADPRKVLHDRMRSLHRHRQELQRLEALRDDELDRIHRWFDDVSHGERERIAQLTAEVEQWAKEHRTDRAKSFKTPWGTVSTRVNSKGRAVVYDEAALIEWCEENGYLAPPPPPKPDIAAIRAQFTEVYDLSHDGSGIGSIILRADPETDAPLAVLPGLRIEGIGDVTATVGGE